MKYIEPSYKLLEAHASDIITASVIDNGNGAYEVSGKTYEGEKGTFLGFFDDII